jgi:uncharacterized integral membrane protein
MRLLARRRSRQAGPRRIEEWQPRLYAVLIGLALLIAYAIAFVLENRKRVGLHFVFATARVSLIWLILLSFAIGLVAGVLLSQLYRRRRRQERGQTRDTFRDLGG